MNERILELIKAVGGISYDDDGKELSPMLVGNGLQKFAELIVRECADFVSETATIETLLGDRLKEHFGVE